METQTPYVQQRKSELQQAQESFSDIQLTELETEQALAKARMKKAQDIASAEYKEKMRREELLRNQSIPAEQMELRAWNYLENILKIKVERGGEFERVLKLLALYFSSDERFEQQGYSLKKGISLWGKIGCGKTTLMKAFNLNPKQSYVVTSCKEVVRQFRLDGINGIDIYNSVERDRIGASNYFGQQWMGRCFDDLGTEELASSFGNKSNVMADILLSRYDNCTRIVLDKENIGYKFRDLTHITTNLTVDELEQEYGSRLRSRFREMFNLIEFDYSTSKDLRG